MKVMWCNVLVMAVVMTISGGCVNAPEEKENRTCLKLKPPDEDSEDLTKIRFGSTEKKDEETLAKEKAAQEWNRNLILRNSNCDLDEYMRGYENK